VVNIVNNDAQIKQYFENAQGIQRKLTPLTAKENYFKSLQNMQLGLGYSLEGETGFQQIGQFGRFYGLASYSYLNTSTGKNQQDLLAFNGWMWKLVEYGFIITRVSGNTSWGWKHYYSTSAGQFRFEIIQGGAVVFSQNLGSGLEELPYNIDNLIVAINASGIFTAAYTTTPSAISNANQTVIGPNPIISVDSSRLNANVGDYLTFYNYYNSFNPGVFLNRNSLSQALVTAKTSSTISLQYPGYIQLVNNQGLGLASIPAANIPLQEVAADTNNTKTIPFHSWTKVISALDFTPTTAWTGIVALGTDIYATAYDDDVYKQFNLGGEFGKFGFGFQTRNWNGIDILSSNVYACLENGDIYRQLNGAGAWAPLNQTSRAWRALGAQGADMYACVTNGDIYQQFGGAGNFIALGQTSRNWAGLTQLGDFLYASVNNGDIYKAYRKINPLAALNQTLRDWYGMTVNGNNVYAADNGGDIYMQTNGTGNFNALSQTSRNWSGMATLSGNVYAADNGGDIYMQTNGTGNFNALSQTSRNWQCMGAFDGQVYASGDNLPIYVQKNGTGNFITTGSTSQTFYGITGYSKRTYENYIYAASNTDIFESRIVAKLNETSRGWYGITSLGNDIYVSVANGDIYKQTGGVGSFVGLGQTARNYRHMGTFNNNVYVAARTPDNQVYVQVNGVGNFNTLGLGSGDYFGICGHTGANPGIYVTVIGGDILKQNNGVGAFNGLSQTSRSWTGIASLGNDVYACTDGADIYKQTNGTGNFVALGQTSRAWRSLFAYDGDMYATTETDGVTYGQGNLYRQIGGTGNFISCDQVPRAYRGLHVPSNGDLYVCEAGGDIYRGFKPFGFTALNQPTRVYTGMTTIGKDVYVTAPGNQVYRRIGGMGNFIAHVIDGRNSTGLTALGNKLYAAAQSGNDIFASLQPEEFAPLSQTTRAWRGMTTQGSDVYACVYNGDVYKQTNGSGNFTAIGQTTRNWTDITAQGSDLYGCADNQDIYKIPAAGNLLESVTSAATQSMPFGNWFIENDSNSGAINVSNINTANAQQAFYVVAPSSFSREHEGYPYKYDGRFVSRAGLPRPTIQSISNTGSSTLTNTYYDYIVVARYRDARGIIVESRASEPFRINRGSIFTSATSDITVNSIRFSSGFNVAGAKITGANVALSGAINVALGHLLKVGDPVFFRVQGYQRGATASATIISATNTTLTLGFFNNCSANDSLIVNDYISYGLTFRAFRTKTNGVNFFFAGEAPNNPLFSICIIPTENLQTIATADNNLGYQYEEPIFGEEPDAPPRAKVITVHDGRLVLGQGQTEPNSIYWSRTGGAPSSNLESFPALNTAVIPSTQKGGITALISDKPGSLIVGKPTGIYVVEGDLGNRNFGVEIRNEGDWGLESQSSVSKVNGIILGVCQLGITALQDGKLSTGLTLPINPLIENDPTWNPSLAIATNDVSNKEYHVYIPYLNTNFGSGNREELDKFVHLGLDYINGDIWLDKKYPRGMQPSGGLAVYNNDRYHLSSGGAPGTTGGRCFRQLKGTSLVSDHYQFHGQPIPYIVETYPMHNGDPSFDKLWIEMKLWNLFLSVDNDLARFVPFTWTIKTFLGFNNSVAITDTTETFSTVNDYEKMISFFQQPESRALTLQLTCQTIKECPRLTGFEIIFKDLSELGRFYK
jgi:hypothetical protein